MLPSKGPERRQTGKLGCAGQRMCVGLGSVSARCGAVARAGMGLWREGILPSLVRRQAHQSCIAPKKAPVGAREGQNAFPPRAQNLGGGGIWAAPDSGCALSSGRSVRAAVESVPGKLGGARVFAGTRAPVSSLFGNLAAGATVAEFLDWFPCVEEWQVKAVLEHEISALDAKVVS